MSINPTDKERLQSIIDATILSKDTLSTKPMYIYKELEEVFAVHVTYEKKQVYSLIKKRLKLRSQTPSFKPMTETNEQLSKILKTALNKKRKQVERQRRKAQMLISSPEEKDVAS